MTRDTVARATAHEGETAEGDGGDGGDGGDTRGPGWLAECEWPDIIVYSSHIAKKTTSHPWRLDAQPHRAVEAPAGLKACFEPLFSTSSPALSKGHYDSLSTPRLDKFCEPMGWPPAQPSFSGAPSPTVRRDRESTKSPLLLAAARAMQFLSPRACCRRGAKVSCSAGGCLSHGVMMQRVCC